MQNHFSLNPSRIFAALLLLIHGVSLATLAVLPVTAWLKWAGAAACLLSLTYYLRRDAWLSLSSSCVALRVEADHVVLATQGGGELAGQLQRDSVVTPYLIVLNVLPQGARFTRSVVVFPDAIATEDFRELRVILRWGN